MKSRQVVAIFKLHAGVSQLKRGEIFEAGKNVEIVGECHFVLGRK
jgi:hypothetical protein